MATRSGRPAKRVFFHVGAPKTGTTYLQQVLFRNREELAQNGVLYPYERFGDSFRSSLDFRGVGWGGRPPGEYAGAWGDVARRARQWGGHTVIVSNELLGGAAPDRIREGLEAIQPAEVHVIFSARDLARQLVSDWQEHVKHKHTITLEKFVDDLVELGLNAPKPFGEMFWGLHDAVHVLGHWATVVPPQNVHVITVPQPGAPRDTLWQRFCRVTDLDPTAYQTEVTRSNPSMGVVETELVRRMNVDLRDLPPQHYDRLVRIHLAERVLGGQSARLTLPPHRMDWVVARSRRLVDELKEAGYRVEGDLEELMPDAASHADHVSPTSLTDADLAPAAIRAATGMVRHSSRLRYRIEQLQERRASTVAERLRSTYEGARGRAGRLLRRLGLRR